MVRTVPHRELRNDSGRILREVQSGETVAVTTRGEVVALLIPATSDPRDTHRVRTAKVQGGFSGLPRPARDRPTGEVLDELRTDR